MKDWIKYAQAVTTYSRNTANAFKEKFPHTTGMIRRWKDDNINSKIKPIGQKMELNSASKNFQRDFKKASQKEPSPAKPSKSQQTKQAFAKDKAAKQPKSSTIATKQTQSVKKQTDNPSLNRKEDFAKAKATEHIKQNSKDTTVKKGFSR